MNKNKILANNLSLALIFFTLLTLLDFFHITWEIFNFAHQAFSVD